MNQAREINRFEYMATVYPDLATLRALSASSAEAVWELLCMAVFIDGECSEWEAVAIQRIGMMMPNLAQTSRQVAPSASALAAGQDRRATKRYLSELSARLGDEAQREAAYKMLCLLSTIDELELEEIDFLERCAEALGIDRDMAEHMLRSSWETCRAHYYAA